MMAGDICLRPCRLTDLDALVRIYREGFDRELSFFFRRFCRRFFKELFRFLSGDTIVAEVNNEVVGFVIVILGPMPIVNSGILRLIIVLPALLTATRSSLFICVLQKMRNMDWGRCQVGIGCIAVKRDFQKKGIGKALMYKALARYPRDNAILDVRSWNESAIRLYESVGFKRTSAWRDPLGEWIVMRRTTALLREN